MTDVLRRAELAYENAQFGAVIGLLHQASTQLGGIPAGDAYRYHTLGALLAERAGNWGEAVRSWLTVFDREAGEGPCDDWCDCDVCSVLDDSVGPYSAMPCECCPTHVLWGLAGRAAGHGELQAVLDAVSDPSGHRRTAVVHALALGALRSLADAGPASPRRAGLAISLWRILLDEDDPLGFRAMITARRGAPVTDELWRAAHNDVERRTRDTLRAVDVREGRDTLGSWETAWQVEQETRHAGVGMGHPVPPDTAAEFLLRTGRHLALLDAYTHRHPDPGSWTARSESHRDCAPYIGQALIRRGHERSTRGERAEALADFATAVRLGTELDNRDRAEVRAAGLKAGQNRNGYQKGSPVQRIHWLESALVLAPGDRELAGELASVLIRRGRLAARQDRREGRQRFVRALELRPGHPDAQDELDALLVADVVDVLEGWPPDRKPGVKKVEELLRRRFDRHSSDLADAWLPALRWFGERMTEGVVDDALKGKTDTARRKVKRLRAVTPHADPLSAKGIDAEVARLLRQRADHYLTYRPHGYAQDLRAALVTAAELEGLDRSTAERHLVEAVLPLATDLVDEGREAELIALYAEALPATGHSADFDQLVATAYGRRAKERRTHGDLGGAARDERTALALRLQPSRQISLFDGFFDGLFDDRSNLFAPRTPPESDGGATPSQEML